MNEVQIKEKLDRMKKTRKVLGIVTILVAVACMALLIGYNFLEVTYLKSPAGSEFEKGFAYPGWQMIFYGFGIQYIMQHHQFDPNPITIVGMLGTFFCLLICTLSYSKGKNMSKAIKEFISGGFLVYSACVLGFFIIPVASLAATNAEVYKFKDDFITNPNASFTAMPAATICGVVFLIAGIIKIANGVFLLYQKNFAKKNAKKN